MDATTSLDTEVAPHLRDGLEHHLQGKGNQHSAVIAAVRATCVCLQESLTTCALWPHVRWSMWAIRCCGQKHAVALIYDQKAPLP